MEILISLDSNVLLAEMWCKGMIFQEEPVERSKIISIKDHRWIRNNERRLFLIVQLELEPSEEYNDCEGICQNKRWVPYNNVQCNGLLNEYIDENREKMSTTDYRWLWIRSNTKIPDQQIGTILSLEDIFG